MTRFSQRTLVQQSTLANWGKAAPTGIGVVGGYGVATGGTSSSITVSSESYTLLTFTSDGNLVVSAAGLFDVLMFGGGGGGGGASASSEGGGGAGGIIQSTIYLDAATYALDVGAGGSNANCGFGSSINTASRGFGIGGGGVGGFYPTKSAGSGESAGGGPAINDPDIRAKGLSINLGVSGYDGGQGVATNNAGSGGGGGATANGANGVGTTGGAGGAGYDVSAFISGSALFKGGGGGGGGSGGGGAGGSSVGGAGGTTTGSAAAANTASGGGGGANGSASGGAGGSGIVYIRFKV